MAPQLPDIGSPTADNRPRLHPGTSGYEFWQLQINDPEHQFGWRIRLTVTHAKDTPSGAEVQFAYFNRYNPDNENRRVSQEFDPEHFEIRGNRDEPFEFRAGNIVLTGESCQGILSTFEETIRWKLAWFNDPDSQFRHWPNRRFYRWKYPRTKMLTPVPRSMIGGKISVGALDVGLEEAYGHMAHWWGRRYPERWHWAHCTAFEETDFASLEMYEIRLNHWLPKFTLVQLELFGELFEFNSLRQAIRNASEPGPESWMVAAESETHRLQVELQTRAESFIKSDTALFSEPGKYVKFTGIASMQVLLSEWLENEWHVHKKLTCRDAAAYEYGTNNTKRERPGQST